MEAAVRPTEGSVAQTESPTILPAAGTAGLAAEPVSTGIAGLPPAAAICRI